MVAQLASLFAHYRRHFGKFDAKKRVAKIGNQASTGPKTTIMLDTMAVMPIPTYMRVDMTMIPVLKNRWIV